MDQYLDGVEHEKKSKGKKEGRTVHLPPGKVVPDLLLGGVADNSAVECWRIEELLSHGFVDGRGEVGRPVVDVGGGEEGNEEGDDLGFTARVEGPSAADEKARQI
jgi:hypothetical protein